MANAPKDARQNTRAIASIVINTVPVPEFVTSIKRNSITKSNAVNILSDTERTYYMNLPITVTQEDLLEILLNVAPGRPVFIWGAPGIGKSALVEQFAEEIGLPCVSLLGSQLAPEDIIGIPQINGNTSEFLPPKMIARKDPYVLFLDELNACSQEVQKAFYSLIHERRIGEYHLPEGSIVVGAGNRAQDSAIVKTMSSALINRMFHVQMKAYAQ